MRIELLVVEGCPHAEPARALLREILAEQRSAAYVTTFVLTTDDEARSRSFAGSPTFLLDGRDPFPSGQAPSGLACRMYATDRGLAGLPDREELARAIFAAASAGE